MSDDKPELTRRRVLGGITTIGVASAAAGAGTMAYFSDTESSSGNTVSAGTLDLKADGGDSAATTVSVSDIAPGDSGSGSTTLSNDGSINGVLSVDASDTTNAGNDFPEPENDTQTSDDGDLGQYLEVAIFIDDDQDGSATSGETGLASGGTDYEAGNGLQYDIIDNYANASWSEVEGLNAGETDDFVVKWKLPTSVGNVVQDDSVSIDFTFTLDQA